MRRFLTALVCIYLSVFSLAQSTPSSTGGGKITGGVTLVVPPVPVVASNNIASEPINWVNNHECDLPGAGVINITIPNASAQGPLNHVYTTDPNGVMQFFNDWAGRPGTEWWHLTIAAGTLIHGNATLSWGDAYQGGTAVIVIPTKAGSVTGCAVVESQTPLTANQTACSHAGATGTRNTGCNGSHTNPDGTTGANDLASMWTLEVDKQTSSSNALVFPSSSTKVVIKDAEITLAPGSNQGYSYAKPASQSNALVVLNGSHEGLDRDYIHGWDPGDPGQPAGACENWILNGTATATNGSSQLVYAGGNAYGDPFNPATTTINGTAYTPSTTLNIGGSVVNHVVSGGTNYTIASVANDAKGLPKLLNLTTPYSGTTGVVPIYLTATPWHPYETAAGCGDDVGRAVIWAGNYSWVTNTYMEKIHTLGAETQVMSGGRGFGPFKSVNNWQEGGSESNFIGGFPVQNCFVGGVQKSVDNCTFGVDVGPPADIELRRNRYTKNPDWRWLTGNGVGSPGPANAAGGQGCGFAAVGGGIDCPWSWAIKNDFEIKLGLRVLADGNIIENDWPDGQSGGSVLLDPRTCSGGAQCGAYDKNGLPVTATNDLRMTNSIVRNATYLDNPGPRSGANGSGNGVSQGGIRWYHYNELFYNGGDQVNWGGSLNAFDEGAAMYWGVGQGQSWQCTMSTTSGTSKGVCVNPFTTGLGYSSLSYNASTNTATMGMGSRQDPIVGSQITISGETCTGCAGYNGTWTILQDSGTKIAFAPSTITFQLNPASPPTGSCSGATCLGIASFQSYATNETDIAPGDIVWSSACKDGSVTGEGAKYNSPTPPSQFVAAANNDLTSLTVLFANNIPDDNSGVVCTIQNKRGWQKNQVWSHNTVGNINEQNFFDPTTYPQGAVIQNNIFASASGAVFYCKNNNGAKALACGLDTSSLTFNYNVLPGFGSAGWSIYPGGSGGTLCSSQGLTGLCFPTTVGCPNATVSVNGSGDPTCVGFQGFMSGTAFPLSPSASFSPPYGTFDYHNFKLHSSSPYKSGGLDQASDGKDMGVDFTALDNALTRTQYVCDNLGGDCTQNGAVHGPYPD